jgi:hypothetical protein
MIVSVYEQLYKGMRERMIAGGWAECDRLVSVRPSRFAAGHLCTFVRASGGGFVALAVFAWLRESESSPLVVVGHVGLGYKPADDVLAALTDPEVVGAVLLDPRVMVQVSGDSGVRGAVEQLVSFVYEQAPSLEDVRHVGRIIELLRDRHAVAITLPIIGRLALDAAYVRSSPVGLDGARGEQRAEEESPAAANATLARAELTAVLLAVTGRHDEARTVLADYKPPIVGGSVTRGYHRFVRQFTRFLDARDELPLPVGPPRWPAEPIGPEPRPNVLGVLAEQLPEATAQREAVESVRAVSPGKTRDELRTLLERELDRRGVSMIRPELDMSVDLLATRLEPFGKTQIMLRALGALRELATSWRKSPPGRKSASPRQEVETGIEAQLEPSQPEWLRLPDDAAYPILGSRHHRVPVRLDPAARGWLDHVAHDSSPGWTNAMRVIEVWLTQDTESSTTKAHLNVHIGIERVGQLDPDVTESFQPAMEAAAERGEHPWTYAYLTATSGEMPYRLEVALPRSSAQ